MARVCFQAMVFLMMFYLIFTRKSSSVWLILLVGVKSVSFFLRLLAWRCYRTSMKRRRRRARKKIVAWKMTPMKS